MTTTYRYLFADLLTNEIIGELPLIQASSKECSLIVIKSSSGNAKSTNNRLSKSFILSIDRR